MPQILLPARSIARLGVLLVLALLAGFLLATGPIASARADDGTIGIAGAPSDGTGTDGRSRFSYQVAPGQHLDDAYQVTNTGSTAQTITVLATDAYNTDDGGYGLLDSDAKATDAGSWVTFADGAAQHQVTLEPGASEIVQFAVDVPADARPGDHAAGIVISALSAADQILVDRRVGTRLYVRVPGDLQPALTVASITSSYSPQLNPFDGATTLTYTIKNSGNVALGATTVVGVKTVFGIATGDLVRTELPEMLPGSTRTVSVVVHGVGQWGYLNPYVSLAPTVDDDALNPGPLRTVDRDTVLWVVPWVLLVLVLLALGIWLWIRFSRRRNDKNAKAWVEYTEAEARRKAAGDGTGAGAGAGGSASAEELVSSGSADRT